MKEILKKIETPYVDAQTLLGILGGYKKPREWIRRMVNKKELIRLKNGLYLISDRIQPGALPFEQIANILYGPSYVSLEWALSFYGMIPERVYTVTSMVLGRNKEYRTAIGNFVYHRSKSDSHFIGLTQKASLHSVGSFLIATPEKAIADLIYVTCKKITKKELRDELLESKRMDRGALIQLDKKNLREISEIYRSERVYNLIEVLKTL
jgi:predicted transcriptional regulator of viral defense system